jgi:hypothetical protein
MDGIGKPCIVGGGFVNSVDSGDEDGGCTSCPSGGTCACGVWHPVSETHVLGTTCTYVPRVLCSINFTISDTTFYEREPTGADARVLFHAAALSR